MCVTLVHVNVTIVTLPYANMQLAYGNIPCLTVASSAGIRAEVRISLDNPITPEGLVANSRLADEMSMFMMLHGVGWKRGCLHKSLDRMEAMTSAASVLLTGADADVASKQDRYMIARVLNTAGYTNGRLGAMVQQFTCRYA